MNKFILILFLAIPFSGFCQKQISIEKTDCFFKDCSQFSEYPNAEFGYLIVPEDYDNPNGKSIKIAFSIIKSTATNPEPDPILIFGGGWGNPNLNNTLFYWNTIPIKNRDVILYDYRGSGYSQPNLCPDLGAKQWKLLSEDHDYKSFTEIANKQCYDCLDELNKKGIDYKLYGTENKTIDAVKLIEHLGYSEVNLFGISNGTMGIQGFIRASEKSSVKIRSIYSDSNVPITEYLNGNTSLLYKKVLDQILDDCSNNPGCERTYPNLKERFHSFLLKTQTEPIVHNGEKEFIFNSQDINGAIHQLLYNRIYYKDIPLILEAFMANDLKFMEALYDNFENIVKEQNGTSIVNYVYDWKARQEIVIEEYKQTLNEYPEFMISDFYLDFYISDSTVSFNARDTIPIKSDIPAIVLAGTYDPITSVEHSRIMHDRYENSYYYELKKMGHGIFGTSCGNELFQAFIEEPNKKPNDDCVKESNAKLIDFTTTLYRNNKVNKLIQEVGLEKNVFWISLLAFSLLFSFIVCFKEIIFLMRKKNVNVLNLLQSVFILLFLIGLVYFSFETIQKGGLTLLFGLVGSSWLLPWLSIIILILALIIVYRMIKTSNLNLWNFAIALSSIFVGVVIFSFEINLFGK